MELAHRWINRDLTRLELVMVLLILSLLIGAFSRYTLLIFARAEKSMVERTVININTALNYRASIPVLKGQYGKLEVLKRINPMEEMQQINELEDYANKDMQNISLALSGAVLSMPLNYGGTITSEQLDTLEKGKWYFNNSESLIIYLISNTEFFNSGLSGPARIRFRIAIDYKDNNLNGRFDKNVDQYKTLKLKPVDQYIWDI